MSRLGRQTIDPQRVLACLENCLCIDAESQLDKCMDSYPLSAHVVAAPPLRVLVVEDRAAYAFIIKDMLTRYRTISCEVSTVTSLTAALERVAGAVPDAILLDLGLPDSFGFQTYSVMREAAPGTPIVIMTALDDEELARRAVRQGAQDFLCKDDITPDLLVRSLSYAIERSRATRALSDLSGSLLRLQDDERRRIGRQLHEVSSQQLAAASMELAVVGKALPADESPAREALDACKAILSSCAQQLRTMTYLLHAPLLDELGLPGAVRELADGFAERCGIAVDLEIADDWPNLREDESLALFRVLQESLENVLRHSGSRTASIKLNVSPGVVVLEVEDAGVGLPEGFLEGRGPGASVTGVGILGMKERMRQLGGTLRLESAVGGTLVRATLPLPGSPS